MNLNDKKLPKPFRFYEKRAECFLSKTSYDEVFMLGFRKELDKLKTSVSQVFDDVSRLTHEIEYHGWQSDEAKNMREIEYALVQRLLEVYLICQMGLGREIYVNHDEG